MACQEWPDRWPTFIVDRVEIGKMSESKCLNSLEILSLFSTFIFKLNKDDPLSIKCDESNDVRKSDVMAIYSLCEFAFMYYKTESVLKLAFDLLDTWMANTCLDYIFETNIIAILINTLLPQVIFRIRSLQCLTAIVNYPIRPAHHEHYQTIITLLMSYLSNHTPSITDFQITYTNANNNDDRVWIDHIACCLTGILRHCHLFEVENDRMSMVLFEAHQYLLQMTYIQDKDIFNTMIDYWTFWVAHLKKQQEATDSSPILSDATHTSLQQWHIDTLNQLRVALICNMVEPQDSSMDIHIHSCERQTNTRLHVEPSDLYLPVKQLLVDLAHLNIEHTENIILKLLEQQWEDGDAHFNEQYCTQICWAIGIISTIESEPKEHIFIPHVLKILLGTCDLSMNKKYRALIGANIIYVVEQYPRFLVAHPILLKTILSKLFEWMREPHPGVKEMACNALSKIALQTKSQLIIMQLNDAYPYIERMLDYMNTVPTHLADEQVYMVYTTLSDIIGDADVADRKLWANRLIDTTHACWNNMMRYVVDNEPFTYMDVLPTINRLVKINTIIAKKMAHHVDLQIEPMYSEMLKIYKQMCKDVSNQVLNQGLVYLDTDEAKALRSTRQVMLILIQTYVSFKSRWMIDQGFITWLLYVLEDYKTSCVQVREFEVLTLVNAVVSTCHPWIIRHIASIFDTLFLCTETITTLKFNHWMDHTHAFFALLRTLNKHYFNVLWDVNRQDVLSMIPIVVWAFQHDIHDVAIAGLLLCSEILDNIAHYNLADLFYCDTEFFLPLFDELLGVMTDGLHTGQLSQQIKLMMQMILAVQDGSITKALWNRTVENVSSSSNVSFLRKDARDWMTLSFSKLDPTLINDFVIRLFDGSQDKNNFKHRVQTFLDHRLTSENS